METTKIILIIEDEKDLAELVAFNLEREGYQPVIALDGPSGLEAAQGNAPDLILLDLMLPGMPGIDICKVLKGNRQTAKIPIILLTAKGEEIDRVVGFEIGADDYVVKPFSTRELLLRVKAVLRRAQPENSAGRVIKAGSIVIDTERHIVTIDASEIIVTTTEFKLLLTLAERLGRLQSRELLLKDVWGYNYSGDTRTVDTHITRLRTKLGEAGGMIKTIRGFGYKMETE
ncbi:MAG TPA: response regulator transcription factor [Geobacteraceae bacterium]|jgi:two-component system phosphate regulon response regulator PhoB|nr:response regulator transcription factor [Geobacteraceae bacterium]